MTRTTHTIDATGKKLGRIASEAASVLMGKNRTDFVKHQAPNVEVVVTNADKIDMLPKKREQKTYITHSGFPGGQKVRSMDMVIDKHGMEEIVRRAVRGMLPKNRLQSVMLKNLRVEK